MVLKRLRHWILQSTAKFRKKKKWCFNYSIYCLGWILSHTNNYFYFLQVTEQAMKNSKHPAFHELSLTITCFWRDRKISKQKWDRVKSRYVDLTFTWACAVYVFGRSTAVQTNRFTGCCTVSRILHTLRIRSWQFSLFRVALNYYGVSILLFSSTWTWYYMFNM